MAKKEKKAGKIVGKVEKKAVQDAEDSIRDLLNWLAVFKREYNIPEEAYGTLCEKIEELSTKISGITCTVKGVDANTVKASANTLRDVKAWLAVFVREYNIEKEAVNLLSRRLDELGRKLAAIECK